MQEEKKNYLYLKIRGRKIKLEVTNEEVKFRINYGEPANCIGCSYFLTNWHRYRGSKYFCTQKLFTKKNAVWVKGICKSKASTFEAILRRINNEQRVA